MENRVSLDELEERLDDEIDRVNQLTEQFTSWSEEQRAKLDSGITDYLHEGDIPLSDFNLIINTMKNIESESEETIAHVVHLLEQLSEHHDYRC